MCGAGVVQGAGKLTDAQQSSSYDCRRRHHGDEAAVESAHAPLFRGTGRRHHGEDLVL